MQPCSCRVAPKCSARATISAASITRGAPFGSTAAHAAAIAAFGAMRLDRDHAPIHFVGAGWERLQRDLQRAAAGPRTGVDALTGAIVHRRATEGCFERLCKRQSEPCRRLLR